MSYGKGGGQGVQPSTGNPLTDYMGTQPGGATSAQPSANLGSMLSPSGQANQSITPAGAYSQLAGILFGNNPQTASLTSPLQNMGVSAQDASSILSDVVTGLPPGVSPSTPFSQYPQLNSQQAAQPELVRVDPGGTIGVDHFVDPFADPFTFGKGGGQPIAQPAPVTQPSPDVYFKNPQDRVAFDQGIKNNLPAPVTQPKQNSLTQALARTRTAGQGYVRPQARQVARNTQPRLSTAPIRTRTK